MFCFQNLILAQTHHEFHAYPCALAFLLRIFPDLSTSATDSGIFLLSVSGSMSEKSPAVTEKMPKMITGMAAWMSP